MKLLVTGGSGYVGAAILRRVPQQWKIAATYFAHRIESADVAVFRIDLRDADAVNRLFDECHPDVVIHTAAVMTGEAMRATNADGSRNVARAAARSFDSHFDFAQRPLTPALAGGARGTRLIHLSSDVIFDGAHAPYDESAPPDPITPYAESKAQAEAFVQQAHSNSVIVRTSLVYGLDPLDPRTRQTLAGEMPHLFTDEYRCPIFVNDLADALIELAERQTEIPGFPEEPGISILNIAGPQRLSRYDFGVKLADALHVAPRFEPALTTSFPSPRPRDCTLDISLAQKILRTRLRGVDEVVNEWRNE